ncbi:uncharacterized protein LOC123472168 [Daphnia magna]|uniref:uncharacterized protein LOC123472168 n=1 Tax=Daphnia magna TaxID=35525 RepID=UPI001E1BDEB0|nr:uncharacterized protein LOC123472168 [Daphnia magna]
MVKICAIVGCINKAGSRVSFFCIPKVIQKDTESEQQLQKKRRSLWIKQLKNSISITDHSDTRVCNEHFITGTPNKDESHPDWVRHPVRKLLLHHYLLAISKIHQQLYLQTLKNRLRNTVIIWILKQQTLIPKMNQLMK